MVVAMQSSLGPGGLAVEVARAVPAGERDALADFLDAAAPPGADAMSEEQLLALRGEGREPAASVFVRGRDERLLAYGQLLRAGDAWVAERVVPPHLPRGAAGADGDCGRAVAASVLDALLSTTESLGGGRLEIWVRAAGPRDDEAAERAGMRVARRLLQLRRDLPLDGGGARPATRPFRPGVDEAAFLAANARAFAALPDQGGWSLRDLEAREQQPWFDPAGFLVHDEGGRLVAFCWTKLHIPRSTGDGVARTNGEGAPLKPGRPSPALAPSPPPGGSAHRPAAHRAAAHRPEGHQPAAPPLGEIYVIGVDPAAQRSGLGRGMLFAGCDHLYAVGAREVMLYADASNVAARALYRASGFTAHHEDRCYVTELPRHPTPPGGRSEAARRAGAPGAGAPRAGAPRAAAQRGRAALP
jgi:mycothiol synthase